MLLTSNRDQSRDSNEGVSPSLMIICSIELPSKKEFAKIAYNYCLLGATDADLSEFLGVGLTTFRAWKGCHEVFSDALKRSAV
jgi:hypothetical protein